MTPDPVQRSLVAVDIEGFGRRGDLEHVDLREALRKVCREAFAQINADGVYQEDRGDALLIVVGPEVSKPRLVNDLIRELDIALRRWNGPRLPRAQMRLRVALHNGDVLMDADGLAGHAVVTLMRLLDAGQLKQSLKTAPHDLAVIVSERMHHDAIAQGHRGIDPADYRAVHISIKEFNQPAWIRVPGMSADRDGTSSPSTSRTSLGGSTVDGQPTAGSSLPEGVSFAGPATFHGPASFGSGHAIGGSMNLAGHDVRLIGRDPDSDD